MSAADWRAFIQNESYVPPPTPYSPRSARGEDPLVQQERHCREKLQALRQVRSRFRFLPTAGRSDAVHYSNARPLAFATEMVFSSAEAAWELEEQQLNGLQPSAQSSSGGGSGIDALGGLESLLFEFFTWRELLVVARVCGRWRRLARLDLFWEPRLVTPYENYPLRRLLGLGAHVPAIQVYMTFRRMKLAQAPVADDAPSAATTGAAWPHTRRIDERRRALMALLRNHGGEDRDERLQRLLEIELRLRNPDENAEPAGEIQLEPQRRNTLQEEGESSTGDDGQREFPPAASVHLICGRNCPPSPPPPAAPTVAAVAAPLPGLNLPERFAGLLAADNHDVLRNRQLPHHRRAGATVLEDDDVYSVADGRVRVNLASWLTTKKQVSETTLRSFLRQMLFAVQALKASQVEHTDISMVNIVVVQAGGDDDVPMADGTEELSSEDDYAMDDVDDDGNATGHSVTRSVPLFQLFFNRRNARYVTTGAVDAAGDQRVPRPLGADVEGNRELVLDAEMGEPGEIGVPGGAAVVDAAGNRDAFPHMFWSVSMIQSLLSCAVTVWAHGRFTDTNTMAQLTLLLRYPTDFSRGFRSFLEFAKYLQMTNAVSVSRLLQHEFVADLATASPNSIVRCTNWDVSSFRDVQDYRSRVLAWYRSATAGVSVEAPRRARAWAAGEFAPRTRLGPQYFVKALEEVGLASERFVSIVGPASASSSWIRALASTQAHTLQRLDLSRVRVPPSVILKELAKLPRVTHLRLPPQFLRDENLEHLIADLAYSNVLPALRAMDDSVKVAMDRLEKSYVMQLDMVTFLLEKPAANSSR